MAQVVSRICAGAIFLVLFACQFRDYPTNENNPTKPLASVTSGGSTYYASPIGSPTNLGTLASPWDLKTALSKVGVIGGGDTLKLRGGTYQVPSASEGFVSSLIGTSSQYVIIANYPGEVPILDGVNLARNDGLDVLRVNGSYVKLVRLVVQDSYSASRTVKRPHLVVNNASHTWYSELVIHDGGDAFYNFADRVDVLVRGCVIYNNGFQGDSLPDHGIYIRSNAGGSDLGFRAEFNILFNQFGYGIHAYSDVAAEGVKRVTLHGNTIFNSGSLGSPPAGKANIILGVGNSVAGQADGVVSLNIAYKSSTYTGPNLYVGYQTVPQNIGRVSWNYVVGGTQVVESGYWNTLTYDNNTFIGASNMVALRNSSRAGLTVSNNKHWRSSTAPAWSWGTLNLTFGVWRDSVQASTDSVFSGVPATNIVSVLGVEPGRVNVTLINWQNVSSFSFTPPPYQFFNFGDSIEVRHVFNAFGAPIAGGRCCSSITVPVTNVAAPVPYGLSGPAPTPGTQLAVYIVTKAQPR